MNAKHMMIERRGLQRRHLLGGLAAAALLAVGGLPLRAEGEAEEVTLTPDARGLFPDDNTLGDPDAPTVLIEYASLSCPHCAHFHETSLPPLKKNWIEEGKLLYVYRDFPTNAPALWAAMLSHCLEGEAYFTFLNLLYKQQREWLTAEDPGAALFELGKIAGFDKERFEACLTDEATFARLVAGIKYAEDTYGVDATPTLILNGEKVRPGTYDELAELIADSQSG